MKIIRFKYELNQTKITQEITLDQHQAVTYNKTIIFETMSRIMGQIQLYMTQSEKIQIISRAVTLLDCFTKDHPELGVREAARLACLPSSTTGRLLTALKEVGMIYQNPLTHTYSLGAKIITWAGVYADSLDVRNKALPLMQELHHATQETISLYVLEGNERVCVERLESPQNVRIVAHLGRRLPLYAGSAGKVFLAFLPPNQRDAILRTTSFIPFTPNTIVDITILQKKLEKIKQDGYALSHGEWDPDASGVAAPIFDINGEIIAALTISGPTQRFTPQAVSQYANEVSRVALNISHEMGYGK